MLLRGIAERRGARALSKYDLWRKAAGSGHGTNYSPKDWSRSGDEIRKLPEGLLKRYLTGGGVERFVVPSG